MPNTHLSRPALLEALKKYTEGRIAGLEFPTAVQKNDTELRTKVPDVFKMRLPDSKAEDKIVPYIIIQFITGKDAQLHTKQPDSTALIRFIFTVYHKNEEAGAIALMNLIDTVRIGLLEDVVIGKCFELDTDAGLETLIYTDDTAPYYAGEMVGTFKLPPIHRRVRYDF